MNFWKNLLSRRRKANSGQHRWPLEQDAQAEQLSNQQIVHLQNLEVMRLVEQGQEVQALIAATQACTLARNLLAEDDLYFAAALSNLAQIHYTSGNYSVAEPLYRRVLEIMQKAGQQDHPHYVATLNNLREIDRRRDHGADTHLHQARENLEENTTMPDSQSQVVEVVLAFVNAQTWTEGKEIVRTHRDTLFTDTADKILGSLLEHHREDQTLAAQIEERRALLARCRREGIDAAFDSFDPTAEVRESDLDTILGWLRAGITLAQNRQGDRAENVERAIHHFRQALTVATRNTFPAEWAMTQNNLASAHLDRTRGDRAQNIEQAIHHYEQALEVYTQEDFPEDWARIHSNLANAYNQRMRGDQAQNIEQAIYLSQQALEVRTREAFPTEWALSTRLLADAYDQRSQGDQTQNVEQAIHYYEQALEVYTQEDFPEDWARTHSNLATAMAKLGLLHDRKGEYAVAEPLYEQALEAMRKAGEEHPAYQNVLNSLANLRRQRDYDADPLLSQAMESWPNDAVMVEALLDISTDVQRAEATKARYQQSGDVRVLDEWVATVERIYDHPQFSRFPWPVRLEIMKETSRTHLERYEAIGRIEDLDRALKLLQDAVEQAPPDSSVLPLLLINLGSGLAKRYEWTGSLADLERSIEAHEKAVEQTDPRSPDFPYFLHGLGSRLGSRYQRTGNPDDLERSVEAHQREVELTDPRSPDFPGSLNGLGNELGSRYQRTGNPDDLERSIEAYERAVDQTDPRSPTLPGFLRNLGRGLRSRYERVGDLNDLERAIQVLRDAARLMSPESPEDIIISIDLGTVLWDQFAETEELPDLREAIDVWEESWSRLQTTFVASPVAYKLGQQSQLTRLSTLLVLAYLELAQTSSAEAGSARRRALEVVEGSKSRLLTELVGRGELLAPPAISPQLTNRERQLLHELTTLDTVELAEHGVPVASKAEVSRIPRLQRREQLRRELEILWDQIAQVGHEAADYVALRKGTSLSWEDIANLVARLGSETVLVSYFSTDDRALLFIVRSGWEEPAVVEIDLAETAQLDLMRRLFRELHISGGSIHRGQTWDRQLRPLLEKAAPYIEGVTRIVLAPYSQGHVIPWSMLALRAGWGDPDLRILPLVTLPALGLLPRLRHHRPPVKEASALVVGNPLGDLQYAEEEARGIADMLGEEALLGPQANMAEVSARLSEATVVHMATHAFFHPDSPLDSGIVLADGVLTAREVMSYRLQADLLVISACQTGIAEALSGDEVAGLAQAFLHAGARSLIVTLWNVNDSSTASLMRTFYEARRSGVDKAEALSRAMASVQAREKWHHPYYWGAFVFMGDW